jgi:exodeoxyribonuclease VII small subunit
LRLYALERKIDAAARIASEVYMKYSEREPETASRFGAKNDGGASGSARSRANVMRKSYKEMSKRLEEIMLWFESGEVDVDEAIKKYEEATKLLDEMEKYLKTAGNKIKKISAKKA